jgi:glycosyltransferase involved in cell wall biosynthesis
MNRYRILFSKKVRSAIRYLRFIIQNYPMMFFIKYLKPNKTYEKGRVTIITPTYNRLNKLKEAIESVSSQTYSYWEHIIVSDGFDQRVQELINQLNDPRIHYKYTLKLNVMGNYQRNYALKYSTGEYILYLDDDNILYKNSLSIMLSGFTSEEVGFVVCPIKYVDTVKDPGKEFKYREIDLLNYMVRRKLVERVWGQCVHAIADYILIDKIRKIAEGNYLTEIIGHHR